MTDTETKVAEKAEWRGGEITKAEYIQIMPFGTRTAPTLLGV